MKLNATDQDRFWQKPTKDHRLILIYGQDLGIINEYKAKYTKLIVPNGDDFCLVQYESNRLVAEPSILFDEACSISFGGGDRLIIINNADDGITKICKDFLNEMPGDGFVLLVGGNLTPTKSTLAQLVDKSKTGLACRIFQDNSRKVAEFINETMFAASIRLDSAGRNYLIERLGVDRNITRNELEKCVLYAADSKSLSYNEVFELVGGGEASTDSMFEAAINSNLKLLERQLILLFEQKVEPIQLVRGFLLFIQKCEKLHDALAEGADFKTACQKLQIFWKSEAMYQKSIQRFNRQALMGLRCKFLLCERMLKESDYPSRLVVEREFVRLAVV